jgi:hypothetical protein
MTDTDALDGEQGAYVPCFEAAASLPAYDQDTVAVTGRDTGRVPRDDVAASLPSDTDDAEAISGHGVGFVAKSCVECTLVSFSRTWNDMNTGSLGTSWIGVRSDRAGAGSFSHQSIGGQGSNSRWITQGATDTETRFLASIHVGSVPTATHYQLTATLRNVATLDFGNMAALDWELVAGNWGMGTPTWADTGDVVATGTIPASTDPSIVTSIEIIATWPITSDYAQWYFRDKSLFGTYLLTNIDNRFPDAVHLTDPIESLISLSPTTAVSFEDWTLDVVHCA